MLIELLLTSLHMTGGDNMELCYYRSQPFYGDRVENIQIIRSNIYNLDHIESEIYDGMPVVFNNSINIGVSCANYILIEYLIEYDFFEIDEGDYRTAVNCSSRDHFYSQNGSSIEECRS